MNDSDDIDDSDDDDNNTYLYILSIYRFLLPPKNASAVGYRSFIQKSPIFSGPNKFRICGI
jgi:hypothetical protein